MSYDKEIDVVAFELDKGLYYIELQEGTYEIDNKRVNISWNENKVIVDLDLKPEIFKLNTYTIIDTYKSVEGQVISKEDYDKERYNLMSGFDVDTDIWDNIDNEYTFKKFIAKWTPQCISSEVKTRVDYNIKYNIYNLPKHITAMRKLNGDLKSTIYMYDQAKHILELVRINLIKYGMIESTRESTIEGEFWLNKDSIRFGKIDKGQFLTIQISGLREFEERNIYKDNYEKVFERYNKNIVDIERVIKMYFERNCKVEGILYGDLLKDLRKIQGLVSEIESKTKTSSKKRFAVESIRRVIEGLENNLLAKGKVGGVTNEL